MSHGTLRILYCLLPLGLAAFCACAADVNFGSAYIGEAANDQVVVIRNPSSSESASYTLDRPVSPFLHQSGSLSGVLAPSESRSVTLGFTAPLRLGDKKVTLSAVLPLTFTLVGSGNVIQSSITLEAEAYGPYPVNAQKVRGIQWDSKHLWTKVAWKSSTGKINDLTGIMIREILFYSGFPSTPTVPLLDYPNFCDVSHVPQIQIPAPWVQGSAGSSPGSPVLRGYPDLNPLAGYGGKPNPRVEWDIPFIDGYHVFEDGHKVGTTAPTLVSGTYGLFQLYEWTAPYLMTSPGCFNWFPLPMAGSTPNPLSDSISRQIMTSGGRWICRITSTRAGTKDIDLGTVSASSSPSSGGLKVSWITLGSMLQSAPTPTGPWTDVLESVRVDEMFIPFNDALGQFFRVRMPAQ